jgi:hypothetical protein
MTEADWYANNDVAERSRRMPTSAPADPPPEYLDGASHWPKRWGTRPHQDAARARTTRSK